MPVMAADLAAELDRLHDALDRVGTSPGRPVSAHLDPALTDAAKAAVALGLADSVSALTGEALHRELRRFALRCSLEDYYTEYPQDRPSAAEVALHIAAVRGNPLADDPDLPAALDEMAAALGPEIDPQTLLTATVGHLRIRRGSAA